MFHLAILCLNLPLSQSIRNGPRITSGYYFTYVSEGAINMPTCQVFVTYWLSPQGETWGIKWHSQSSPHSLKLSDEWSVLHMIQSDNQWREHSPSAALWRSICLALQLISNFIFRPADASLLSVWHLTRKEQTSHGTISHPLTLSLAVTKFRLCVWCVSLPLVVLHWRRTVASRGDTKLKNEVVSVCLFINCGDQFCSIGI